MTQDATTGRRTGVSTSPRTAAMWAAVDDVVRERADQLGRSLRVIDLGGGTGGLAVPLAVAGHDVTVVDPSPDALASLRRRAAEAQASARVSAVQGDADTLASLVGRDRPDLVLCHGTLEYVDDPAATLSRIAEVLAAGGILSLVVPQRSAAVLARALAGQFAQARAALDRADGRWGDGDPVPRRFDRSGVVRLVEAAGLTVKGAHGIRLFSDLVPSALVDSDADRAALLDLERAVAEHPEFSVLTHLGTSLHVIATRP
ncbi:methyltransferase domain-containing protein [Knoellia subterranea]|uniref:Methyltransferase n=1 Tax=Knoellia subterranea KCTC 19937 TaxID=1385521 RepID=A0A0A0JR64_9MICO|nr:methyltransferase domain-containing protein [Knoellia subterranea]KGN38502.1 methyltransferase [Knoellia subterranea KCTC 19937]